MSLEHVLLGMLHRPSAGYDLKREFQDGTRHFWFAELSQIYPTLKRMEARGWLRSRREPSPNGPMRCVYRRTAAGTRALFAWIRSGPTFGHERFAYVGQLIYLGQVGDLDETTAFLERLRAHYASLLELLECAESSHRDEAKRAGGLDDIAFHDRLAVRLGIRSVAGRVAACDDALAMVAERREAVVDA